MGTLSWSADRKQAQRDVLFWAKRLSYASADKHPEWHDRYLEAKARLEQIRWADRYAKMKAKEVIE